MSQANPPSIIVSHTKSQAMTRILDQVSRGYIRYTSGTISADKAIRLAIKFHQHYGIGCTPAQRITRKNHGLANATLILFWPPEAVNVEWLMLATEGSGLESEKLLQAEAKPRLLWLGYELVRHACRGRTSWTWRHPKVRMADWYSILDASLRRRRESETDSILESIARCPGFHGVRTQSAALIEYAQKRGYRGAIPTLYYMRKISHGSKLALP